MRKRPSPPHAFRGVQGPRLFGHLFPAFRVRRAPTNLFQRLQKLVAFAFGLVGFAGFVGQITLALDARILE